MSITMYRLPVSFAFLNVSTLSFSSPSVASILTLFSFSPCMTSESSSMGYRYAFTSGTVAEHCSRMVPTQAPSADAAVGTQAITTIKASVNVKNLLNAFIPNPVLLCKI